MWSTIFKDAVEALNMSVHLWNGTNVIKIDLFGWKNVWANILKNNKATFIILNIFVCFYIEILAAILVEPCLSHTYDTCKSCNDYPNREMPNLNK